MKRIVSITLGLLILVGGAGLYLKAELSKLEGHPIPTEQAAQMLATPYEPASLSKAMRLEQAAEKQIGITTGYNGSYRKIGFPGGDVPQKTGVCSDVVVRAFRGIGIDLQLELNKDMKANFSSYPQRWGLKGPDKNIDHRRVPNLMRFFERQGMTVPISKNPNDYKPGDIVAWALPFSKTHIGIVSRHPSPGDPNRMLVIHNIGSGAVFEDVLFAWPITGVARVSE